MKQRFRKWLYRKAMMARYHNAHALARSLLAFGQDNPPEVQVKINQAKDLLYQIARWHLDRTNT